MIVWYMRGECIGVLSSFMMQREFVGHLVGVFHAVHLMRPLHWSGPNNCRSLSGTCLETFVWLIWTVCGTWTNWDVCSEFLASFCKRKCSISTNEYKCVSGALNISIFDASKMCSAPTSAARKSPFFSPHTTHSQRLVSGLPSTRVNTQGLRRVCRETRTAEHRRGPVPSRINPNNLWQTLLLPRLFESSKVL